ncbi:hypothetical protein ABUE31_21830 [Mesorhizobium sp. ZMM04-5]|uniref:Uncharacterized protein n=1 Tax=Mesorhizobium marinum TaxID=3228790 RepID=A0ABV3R6D0_9HYPH
MRPVALFSLAFLLAVPLAASAETDRYRLEKTPEGYVRLDTSTGAMSICTQRQDELVCRMAADERTAMQDEIERLQAGVKSLEDRVARLERAPAAQAQSSLPTEEDFNRTMGYMERFFRSFMGIVRDFEAEQGRTPAPGANKT